MEVKYKSIIPQDKFLSLPNKYKAFVGGYGSGKTWVGCQGICDHFWEFPLVNQGYFSPTYPMIRDILYPTIEEVAFQCGLNIEIKLGVHEVHFYSGRVYRGKLICRSMDKPGNIIGFKIGHAMIDELDTLPINKADEAWTKIIARMRYKFDGVRNGIDVATTPEGFRFCHKKFVQMVQEDPSLATNYGMVQASTYDNEMNLPSDYIPSLLESYPSELIKAYINGQFTNLTSGTVYRNYDRVRCVSRETIKPGEPLFISGDFNVQKMCSAIYVQRPDGYHMVSELKDVFDTPDIIKIINERWRDKGHRIIYYPDATGGSRKTVDASKSDIALLQQAGYFVKAHASNPPVKDRILSSNKAFEIGKVKVNDRLCPTASRCLEQLAYDDNGEPDKKSGFDHMCDAATYLIAYEFPIIKPMSRVLLSGL
jgi:hypothetical protein